MLSGPALTSSKFAAACNSLLQQAGARDVARDRLPDSHRGRRAGAPSSSLSALNPRVCWMPNSENHGSARVVAQIRRHQREGVAHRVARRAPRRSRTPPARTSTCAGRSPRCRRARGPCTAAPARAAVPRARRMPRRRGTTAPRARLMSASSCERIDRAGVDRAGGRRDARRRQSGGAGRWQSAASSAPTSMRQSRVHRHAPQVRVPEGRGARPPSEDSCDLRSRCRR